MSTVLTISDSIAVDALSFPGNMARSFTGLTAFERDQRKRVVALLEVSRIEQVSERVVYIVECSLKSMANRLF